MSDELEQLRQALHDARIENSGQAADLEREKSRADAHYQNYLQMLGRIDQLVAERRWISVLEKVPEIGVDVLVLQRTGHCEVAWKDIYDGNWSSFAALGEITHWMPLPQPPKEVQG